MKEKIAKLLLESNSVKINPEDLFTWTSGIKSPIYCDTRILNSLPEIREEIVDGFVNIAKNLDFDLVAGAATGGISWAAYTAQKLNKPMVYVRKKAKGHGTGKKVEGLLREGQKVLMIEDIISTGGSSILATEGVRNEGGIIEDCLAILWYEFPDTDRAYKKSDINLQTLSDFSALISVSDFSKETKDFLMKFQEDPRGWV